VAREIVRDDQWQEFVDVYVRDKHQPRPEAGSSSTTRTRWRRPSNACWKPPAKATGRPTPQQRHAHRASP
jgi:hypothetical protein